MLACAALVWLVFRAELSPGWLFASRSYEGLEANAPGGATLRLDRLALAALMVFTLLCLTPNRQGVTATAGQRSLSIYLFHGFVVMAVATTMPVILEDSGRWVALGLCVAIAAAVVALLTLPVFDNMLRSYRDRVVGLVTRPRKDAVRSG